MKNFYNNVDFNNIYIFIDNKIITRRVINMILNSKFGFGCMRLPLIDENDPTSINQELFNQMIDYYLKKGHNFFDTSYAYPNGQFKIALRKGLIERYPFQPPIPPADLTRLRKGLIERYPRESFEIADKMPTWLLEKEEDNEKFFNEMFERLGIEYFDKFHIHNINTPFLKKAKKEKNIRIC